MDKDRKMLALAAGVFMVNILLYLLSLFVFQMREWSFGIFVVLFLYTLFMHTQISSEKKKNPLRPDIKGNFRIRYSGWRKHIVDLTFLTVIVIFISGIAILREGSGDIIDGVYWLKMKSRLVRVISESEYRRLVFAETRMMIGFLMIFTVEPFAHYGEKIYG